jgi:hypothetical protein
VFFWEENNSIKNEFMLRILNSSLPEKHHSILHISIGIMGFLHSTLKERVVGMKNIKVFKEKQLFSFPTINLTYQPDTLLHK